MKDRWRFISPIPLSYNKLICVNIYIYIYTIDFLFKKLFHMCWLYVAHPWSRLVSVSPSSNMFILVLYIYIYIHLWTFQQAKFRVQLNEIREEQAEAVHQQDFMRAQVLLEKIKELQEELQRLDSQPDVVHEQVKVFP